MYRFKDENGSSPKGSPMPAENVDARLVTRDNAVVDEFNNVMDCLPPDFNAVFEVSSIGKTHYFAVESREEATAWINSLRQMKQDTITCCMGHSGDMDYPKSWAAFDLSATRLKAQKSRIKNKLEAMNNRDQEMQSFGMDGTISRGYYA